MEGLAKRNGGRLGLAALAAVLLLGIGLRAGYAWEGVAPVYDAAAYAAIAANLAGGEGYALGEAATQPASNYSPGLPLLVGGLYELSGGVDERLARLALALVGALAVLFTYLIGRRLRGPLAGLVGAGVVAVYPALLEYQGMLMGEPLAATLLSGAILAMLWAGGAGRVAAGATGGRRDSRESSGPERRGWGCPGGRGVLFFAQTTWREGRRARRKTQRTAGHPHPLPTATWLLPGALLGALALVRPEYLGISVLLAIAVLARDRLRWKGGLADAAVLLAGVALVVAPWTVRNAVALDRFAPVSTGGGQVLFAGSYLPSGGDPERVGREVLERHPGLARRLATEHLPPRGGFVPHSGTNPPRAELRRAVLAEVRLEQILAGLAAQRYPGLEADRALARMGRERLEEAVTGEPLRYAGFLAAKVGRIWGHGPRDAMREPVWAALHWALVAFGLLGLVVLARQRRWEALLLATALVAVTATGALLVASPRRALVTIPLVAALAGVAATWLGAAVNPPARREPSGD